MFDIAIIGAGLAGMSLVQALRAPITQGMRVCVIDANQAPSEQSPSPSFDDRVSAISQQTLSLLSSWGIKDLQGTPMSNIHISEARQPASIELSAQKMNIPQFGMVAANKHLGLKLWHARPNNVDFHFQTQVQAVRFQSHCGEIVCADQTIKARLIVVADGGRSDLLDQLNIRRTRHDYQQYAHVFSCSMSKAAKQTAYERFTPRGALALLPHNGHFSAVLVDAEPTPDIASAVQARIGWRLGSVQQIGQVQSYPLVLQQAKEQRRERLIIAGNSALALHPVAGQGYNLVARSMANIANYCQQNEKSLGKLATMKSALANIASDQQQTRLFSDGLARGFLGQSLLLPRQLGMNIFDQHPMIKRSFSQFAMGARNASI